MCRKTVLRDPVFETPVIGVICRGLTYLHLAVFSWLQLVLPARLSYDWQLGSIPLVSGLADPRNLLTLAAAALLLNLVRPAVSNRPAAFGLLFLVLVSELAKPS